MSELFTEAEFVYDEEEGLGDFDFEATPDEALDNAVETEFEAAEAAECTE